MASLFTAVIFWAILKWDEEMEFIQHGSKLSDLRPNRWLLLIFFMLGLAIGVHLLGILVVPAIGYMIYFRTQEQVSIKGLVLTGVISIVALGFIQEAVIPGSIAMASNFEVSFVNSLGLPFYSGTIFFFILLISACLYVVRYAHRAGKTILYNAMMGLVMLLIGYGSFAVIVIRSNANTPLDENDPENLVTLHSYLKREQYGSAPILFGPHWNSFRNGEEMTEDGPKILDRSAWKDLSAYFLRRFVVIENDVEVKAFASETEAEAWVKANKGAYSIEEKYYESNASIRQGAVATYSQTTFFPRMYNGEGSGAALHRQLYAKWSGYNENDGTSTEIGRDGKRLPTFGENLTYFFRYQVNFMYMRYFMWNFAGRQNDLQGHGDNMHGNWLSGISFLDEARLGSQEHAPYYTQENPGRNTYFMLPLILALLGLVFHYRKMPKDAFILTLAFLFTGLAIVVYLNQKPYEPRERDYAYAGSFYFFAMWIGIGVYAIFDLLKKYLKESKVRAGVATALGLIVPVMMGSQNWDDHDRSGKTSARDLAHNYLESCGKNGILFTNGDNDTFPLWYLQEVEGKRTDVRVCNLSLMGTDWYTNQMKLKTYESDPLPIKFREDQILMYAGNTDQVYFMPLLQLFSQNLSDTIIKKVLDLRLKHNPSEAKMAAGYFDQRAQVLFADVVAKSPEAELLKTQIASTDSTNMIAATIDKYQKVFQLFEAARNGQVEFKNNTGQDLQELLEQYERIWSAVDFADAMAFVRDDANMITDEQNKFSFFPSSKFALKVNRQNAIASGVLSSKTKAANVADEIVFEFDPERTQALPRDEVMMMDVVANNDWKRGIYFSSNRGSSFSIALLSAGYIKQVGMAYALTPAKKEPALMDVDQMEKNMLETYIFGDMANPNVLTDYYARRHTIQYRANFLLLAEQLYALGRKNEAIKVLDRSMQIMPEETVMDYGDINPVDPFNSLNYNKAHNQFMFQGQDIRPLNAGILHEFVQLYYLLGQTKKAEALGQKILENYQTVVAYFEHSDVEIAGNEENAEDLIAVADALLKMRTTVKETNKAGNSSAFTRSLEKTIQVLYKKVLPRIYSGLDALASDNGEAGDGLYSNRLANLQLYMGALAEHHGLVKAPVVNRNTLPSEPSNIDVNSLAAPGQATDTNRMMQ
jgi:tetratricopeptide (TPR) repeat protein